MDDGWAPVKLGARNLTHLRQARSFKDRRHASLPPQGGNESRPVARAVSPRCFDARATTPRIPEEVSWDAS
jgi:hypothetical protein